MRIERDEIRTLLILAVIALAFAVGVYLPARAERQALRRDIEAARKELGLDRTDRNSLIALHDQVQALRERVQGTQRYVPRQDELDDLLRSFTEALQAFETREPEIVNLASARFADYSELPVRLEFEGSFVSAYGVLKRIESMPRLIRVNELVLERQDEDLNQPLEVKLELSTFVAGPGEGEE